MLMMLGVSLHRPMIIHGALHTMAFGVGVERRILDDALSYAMAAMERYPWFRDQLEGHITESKCFRNVHKNVSFLSSEMQLPERNQNASQRHR